MTGSEIRALVAAYARDFFPTLWPAFLPTDSEFQRRRKVFVRCAQLAAVALVVLAIVMAAGISSKNWPWLRWITLCGVASIYLVWNVIGTRDVVRDLLWDRDGPPPARLMREKWGAGYCAIQLALAAAVYFLNEPSPMIGMLWLVLLPPLAHSVILMRSVGIGVVSLATLGVFGFFFVRWHGWELAGFALLAFGFAVLFTVVFTLLAVSSERARSEVQRMACELAEANGKLREYAVQAEELASSRERNRLAREIHDALGHYLTVVNVQIDAARVMADRDPARSRDALDKAQSFTREGLADIRRSVSALRASPLDNRSLTEAIRASVEGVQSSGLRTDFRVIGESRPLARPVELTLYRAAQEGLTNVQKHAQARRVDVTLNFGQKDRVLLTVSDDGVGSDGSVKHGFGLLGLRERAHLAGGDLRTRTAPSSGFVLEMEAPG